MNHKEIMKKIGELFLLRTNINSVGSVLDSPVRDLLARSPLPHISTDKRAQEVFWVSLIPASNTRRAYY